MVSSLCVSQSTCLKVVLSRDAAKGMHHADSGGHAYLPPLEIPTKSPIAEADLNQTVHVPGGRGAGEEEPLRGDPTRPP